MACEPLDVPGIVPGWKCCACNLAVDITGCVRVRCRACGHLRCVVLPPELVAAARRHAANARGAN